jgi:hypothetical protein
MKTFIQIISTTYLILVFSLSQTKAQDFGNPSSWVVENNAVLIQSGFPLYLEAQREFSTKDLEQGQNLTFYLKFPVVLNNKVVLYKGTEAVCRINRLEKRGGNGKSGMIEIQPLYLIIGINKILPLSASPDIKGSDHKIDQSQIVNGLVAALSQNMMDYQLLKNENNFNRQQNLPVSNQPVYESMSYGFASQGMLQQTSEIAPVIQQASQNMFHVSKALNMVIPLAGLVVKGKHATIPEGYILNTYCGWNTWVEMK